MINLGILIKYTLISSSSKIKIKSYPNPNILYHFFTYPLCLLKE